LEQDLHRELDDASKALDARLVHDSTPSRQAARREEGVLLANQLAGLPDDYREVVVLRHLEELTFPEIADRMGRSVDSVKKLWARGLARLRAQGEENHGP
jgi:RNA polymerase sigma-70 factor (ECF subfamily)